MRLAGVSLLIMALLAGCYNKDIWTDRYVKERKLKKSFKSKDQVDMLYGEQLAMWDVKPGEVVADIGAYDGVTVGLISLFSDSATVYIQDADTSNFHVFPKIQRHFEGLRGSPFTNDFVFVPANYDSTFLPKNTFNKIILNNVYQYIPNDAKAGFLREIHSVLQDSGYFYIQTPLARNEDEARFIPAEKDLINTVVMQKFRLIGDQEVMYGMSTIFKFQKSDRNGRIRY